MLQSFRPFAIATLLSISGLLTTTACKQEPPEPKQPDSGGSNGQSGYVIGKITDPQGNTLSRATVYIDNTVLKGRGAEANSSADGNYKIQLVKGLGQWIAKGYVLKQYNNRVYKIQLEPENPDSFSEEENPVRNFQWKLTGHIPDLSLNLYYGGYVELYRDLNADGLYDTENVELTFKPVGTLIDGSTGKTLKLKGGEKSLDSDFIMDIPIGRYTISAIYKPTGQALRVRNALANDDSYNYANSVTVDFSGTEVPTRANSMAIGITNR
ncbi:carboxypeptidase-like regulatory domain-containing protein [Spirosoma validum]|uniref:Carboxypeptidase regulatory-like domain-containing protein n=1 Tax=Spirosoma validum TaxID=2771355 RepID=A0A927B5C8_9BACT|nr:carboxypeptidase-like regulatory domain-containing protein [Spirosoma validum]MBD2755551.1 carboxypeptidase regulatory-like domain-containing protein [Spirosoma validum]